MVDKKPFLSNYEDTMALLKKHNIEHHTQEHKPVMTAIEHSEVKCTQEYKFKFSKNMIFKTKGKKFIMYTFPGENKADIKILEKFSGEKNLRNADDTVLEDYLFVKKGSVTPLALLNLTKDNINEFIFVLDSELDQEYIAIHPMSNAYTTWIKLSDLKKLLEEHNIIVKIFNKEKFEKDNQDKAKKEDKKDDKKDKKDKKDDKKDEEKHKLSLQNPKTLNDFSEWYQEIIKKSELIDYYDISGCYIIRPYAYEIWEGIQKFLDTKFKELGVKNCYFPIFVSQDALEREKNHVEGFSPEVAWVTHYGDKKLEKKVAIRPTSETIMYPQFGKWISSHRDIPLLLNQWCNVVRWEFKNPTPFIRTREFLWQEGHSVHETEEESDKFMYQILEIYRQAYEELLAVPVIKGIKSENEKFAGALRTSTVETLITANGKAVQCATSHNLGQNFSKMFDVKYLDKNQNFQYCWQESWGFTTRSIGVLIMTHGDDTGLILPPRIAPTQIVLIPIISSSDKTGAVSAKSKEIYQSLKESGIRIVYDDNELHNPGFKYNYWELKGVPLRIEFGKKDLEKNQVVFAFRDTKEKIPIAFEDINKSAAEYLEVIQKRMFKTASDKLVEKTKSASDFETFSNLLNQHNIIQTPWCCDSKCEDEVKARVKSLSEDDEESAGTCKTLCIPLQQEEVPKDAKCFNCSKEAKKFVNWGRSY